LFDSRTIGASNFFKGVMWAVQAAKLGFRWHIGNGGKNIKFWEDNWLGSSSLAIQFWDLYVIVNEKNGTIHDLWDGENLKCTFRRTADQRLMNDWLELKLLVFLMKKILLSGCSLLKEFTPLNPFIGSSISEDLSLSMSKRCGTLRFHQGSTSFCGFLLGKRI